MRVFIVQKYLSINRYRHIYLLHTCLCACTHISIHTRICIYKQIYIYLHIYAYIYLWISRCSTYICICVYIYAYVIWVLVWKHIHICKYIHTGWRRLIGSPKLQIIFHKRATEFRSLLRKTTYKDKGSYESSPPCICICIHVHTCIIIIHMYHIHIQYKQTSSYI